MSIIHSLDLNEGGGIIPPVDPIKPENGGHIIIGIGGTGIDALKSLKRKVYTLLEPSDPFSPIPRYDSIRFLALDTDEFSLGDPQNERDLQKSEFVNFSIPQLWKRLDPHFPDGRAGLKMRPDLNNWMSIDQLPPLMADAGAGGIRQMGRFLLMEYIRDVYGAIQDAVSSLQNAMPPGQWVNVYILAGISGGTGSGCFIDVCYLVRSVLEALGIQNSKLFGYFFLPDMFLSKAGLRENARRASANLCNGYAALKELDYLMDLPAADDWFDQSYQNGLTIHTQRSPVDLCYPVSAEDIDGSISENSYDYCIDVVSDCILACLTDMSAVIGQGNIPHFAQSSGANYCYTILCAANIQIPWVQSITYLAQGYYQKVTAISCHVPTHKEVTQFAVSAGLTWNVLCSRLTGNTDNAASLASQLAEVPMADCLGIPIHGDNLCAEALLNVIDAWQVNCKRAVDRNFHALSASLPSYAEPVPGQVDAIIAFIHRQLMALCRNQDGQHGAKFAAKLLSSIGFDMGDVVAGLIAENTERLMCEKSLTNHLLHDLRKARDDFYHANVITRFSRWHSYQDALVRYFSHDVSLFVMEKMGELLHILKDQLSTLYTEFYQKLDSLCDDLKDTFEENAAFLADPQRRADTAFNPFGCIKLEHLIPQLDLAISAIDPIQAAGSLMDCLLDVNHQETWLSQSDVGIGGLISGFMLSQFSKEYAGTLDELIRRKYPGLTEPQLQDQIFFDYLTPLNRMATLRSWSFPEYMDTLDCRSAFIQSALAVPAASKLLPAAGQEFGQRVRFYQTLEVCRSASSDRVSMLRQISAVPLCAYFGLRPMREAYEDALRGGVAGIHLYEHNCVLEEKANKTPEDLERIAATAWGSYLPSPIPLSRTYVSGEEHSQEHKALEKLFSRAMELGVIARDPYGYWVIFENRWEGEHRLPSREDYVADGLFSWEKAEAEKLQCEELLGSWTSPDRCRTLTLSGGNAIQYGYEQLVLLDRFVRFPRLAAAVRRSLDNYDYLLQKKAALEALLSAEELRWQAHSTQDGELSSS